MLVIADIVEWMAEFQRVARIATRQPWNSVVRNETFFCTLKKKKCLWWNKLKTIGEGIATCYGIILFCHGYKSHSCRGDWDQFDDVKSLIKYYSIPRSYSFFTTIYKKWHHFGVQYSCPKMKSLGEAKSTGTQPDQISKQFRVTNLSFYKLCTQEMSVWHFHWAMQFQISPNYHHQWQRQVFIVFLPA
jgi:hypothetical protein